MSIFETIKEDVVGLFEKKVPKKFGGYGWIKDASDPRDFKFVSPIKTLPKSVNMRPYMPPILDQGNLGSCTANAIANDFYAEMLRQLSLKTINHAWLPSRLLIYFNERTLEGTVKQDSGASVRDGFKTINTLGVCPETEWPYIISNFAVKPPAKCYIDALRDKTVQYLSIPQVLTQMKGCLASGYPFVFGFNVYESFESDEVAKTGIVPMPVKGEALLGGHCVLACGYDDYYQRFMVMNSWGSGWGIKGYFTIPYAYLTSANLASDFWTIRLVS